ncbi:60S ribosomal protein L23a [Prunus yedoensis var. nudiflora]|uniref:60S ribosomal protein L23a n=1 Tax=Prunus yedoensis var. nudiflora TaxID=2094558 RepID=A0A314ZM14_PRUYE|nr:60S ribosomal protein L23a [Prunus yedoensis var. nudiflora]
MMNHWLKRCTCACRSYHRRYVAETTLELFAVSATILSPQRCRLLRKDRLVGGEGGCSSSTGRFVSVELRAMAPAKADSTKKSDPKAQALKTAKAVKSGPTFKKKAKKIGHQSHFIGQGH